MAEGDEQDIDIDAEHVNIDAEHIIVNTGWTPRLAMWNTVGTVAGAFSGVAAFVLSCVALWIGLR